MADPITALANYELIRRPATAAVIEANRAMDRAERDNAAALDPATFAH